VFGFQHRTTDTVFPNTETPFFLTWRQVRGQLGRQGAVLSLSRHLGGGLAVAVQTPEVINPIRTEFRMVALYPKWLADAPVDPPQGMPIPYKNYCPITPGQEGDRRDYKFYALLTGKLQRLVS
jgi:hypothetical protein